MSSSNFELMPGGGGLIAQLCLTLYDPMDCSLPGSPVHGILQARILEWVGIFSSRGSSQPRDWVCMSFMDGQMLYHWPTWRRVVAQSCPTLCDPMDCSLPGSSVHGSLQARILEWVAISSSRGSSWPRDWTQVSCIASGFFPNWATREAPICTFVKYEYFYSRTNIYFDVGFLRGFL